MRSSTPNASDPSRIQQPLLGQVAKPKHRAESYSEHVRAGQASASALLRAGLPRYEVQAFPPSLGKAKDQGRRDRPGVVIVECVHSNRRLQNVLVIQPFRPLRRLRQSQLTTSQVVFYMRSLRPVWHS
eukprot:5410278-Heterocapsa_arctica.AAC.1